jgi:hypothetical protein
VNDIAHRLAALASLPTAAALGALGALRRARAFHPAGVALTGTWTAADDLLEPLGPGRPWPIVARLSKGVGLPGRTPDVLGLAVRIPDVSHPGDHQDLLVSSSGTGPLGRTVLRPTNDHGHASYSSLVPYQTPLGRAIVWARAEVDGDDEPRTLEEAADLATSGTLHYVVGLATDSRDHLLGEVRLHERLDPQVGESLRFDPLNAALGLRPTGVLQTVRERAYHASQALRPTPEPPDEATEAAVEREATPAG